MSEVEQQLRDLLTRYAQDAPDGQRMLTRVRRSAVLRRRRWRSVAGVAMTLALAALGAVALAARLAPPEGRLSVGRDTEASGFVAGPPVDVTFPFTPPAPPVPGSRPQLTLVAGRPTLQYVPATDPASAAGTGSFGSSAAGSVPADPQADPSPTGVSSFGPPAAGSVPADSKADPSPTGSVPADSKADPSAAGSADPMADAPKAGGAATAGSTTAGSATAVPKADPTAADPGTVDPDGVDPALTDPVTVVACASPWTDGPFTPWVTDRTTTVHGVPAVIGERPSTDGPPDHVLSWTDPAGFWVGISAPETLSTVDLEQFASELATQPITQPGPFDFDAVPANFVVDNVNSSTVTFRPPGIAPSPDFVGKLVVSVDVEPSGTQDGRPVRVGNRSGWLHTVGDVAMLRVDEGKGWSLTVQAPARLRIPEPELLRFAAGVHITATATPARG